MGNSEVAEISGNLGHLICTLECFKGKICLGFVLSARFTLWSIVCKSGNRRYIKGGPDFSIIILQNNYSCPNS